MKSNSSKVVLTEDQLAFVKNNIDRMSYVMMAAHIAVSKSTMCKLCEEQGIAKKKQYQKKKTIISKCDLNWEQNQEDHLLHLKRIESAKALAAENKIEGYQVVKIYPDKVLVIDSSGDRSCPTYNDLALRRL